MFQVGTAIEFPAKHIMPGMEGPEGQLHEHEYRLEVLVERERLDDRGMVCDLDVLDAVLQRIDGTVRDQNLEVIKPPSADAVTVEVFAGVGAPHARRRTPRDRRRDVGGPRVREPGRLRRVLGPPGLRGSTDCAGGRTVVCCALPC